MEGRREVEGWREREIEVVVWECQSGGLGFGGLGVSVSIRHRLTADSCARRDHGQLTRTRPEQASCACTSARAFAIVSKPRDPLPPAHPYRRLIFHPALALSSSPSLCLSLPPQPVHDILQVNQSVSACWHESTAFIQSAPCLSYLLKYFYLN